MSEEAKRSDGPGEGHRVTLCAADAAAVDALVEGASGAPTTEAILRAEQEKGAGKAAEGIRVERVRGWADAVRAACASEEAGAADLQKRLMARTLAAVGAAAQEDKQRERMKFAEAAERVAVAGSEADDGVRRMWFRRYWREAGAGLIAASILLAVLLPMIGTARQSGARVACNKNLGFVSNAFAQYAANHGGELPSVAMPEDGNWMPQGPGYRAVGASRAGHSNAANLLPLVNASYMPGSRLLCPGRTEEGAKVDLSSGDVPDDVRGYSYQNLYASSKPKWDGNRETIVMADRNPLFGSKVVDDPGANSFNHKNRGNYVMRGDGSVTWETNPNVGVNGDNIWTIGTERQRVYKGTETVRNVSDTFLSP